MLTATVMRSKQIVRDETREPSQGQIIGHVVIEDISNKAIIFDPGSAQHQQFINERREQLALARAELEAIINDLENDYGTRDDELWEDTIKTACDIRRAIRLYRIIPQPIAFTANELESSRHLCGR
jgi:hypothetical protein